MKGGSIATNTTIICVVGGAIVFDTYGGYDKDEADQFFNSRQLALKVLSDTNTVLVCKRSFGDDVYWDKTSNTIYLLSHRSLVSFEEVQPQSEKDEHNTHLMQNAKDEAEMIAAIKHDIGC